MSFPGFYRQTQSSYGRIGYSADLQHTAPAWITAHYFITRLLVVFAGLTQLLQIFLSAHTDDKLKN